MSFQGPTFVLAIIFITTAGWVLNNWIRAKHGYPISDDSGENISRTDSLQSERKIELLSNENAGLKGQISRLEERIAVLERIATDPAERTAREIESLR